MVYNAVNLAIEEGLIKPKRPGFIRMEAPAGLVQIEYKLAEENRTAAGNRVKVESVKLTNVPAFLHSSDLIAECPELGELVVDVSYGGNFYAIVDVQENFRGLEYYPADKLIAWARALRKDINARYQFVHPDDPPMKKPNNGMPECLIFWRTSGRI